MSHSKQLPCVIELLSFLRDIGCSLERFAKENNIYYPHLNAEKEYQRIFVAAGKLYYKATMYSPALKIPKNPSIVMLRDHIKNNHQNDPGAFAKKHGDSELFVQNAIDNDALWLSREVLLPMTALKSYETISLATHIDDSFNGNDSLFGREHGRSQQQIFRWQQNNAVWCNGDVYLRKTHFKPIAVIEDIPKQSVLFSDFVEQGLFLPQETRLEVLRIPLQKKKSEELRKRFCDTFGMFSAQVTRYLNYDNTMWCEGNVYKKQTNFKQDA
jgi:hypothetical protein